MREIIIQRLIKSRERILAGGYYGNKRKLDRLIAYSLYHLWMKKSGKKIYKRRRKLMNEY